MKIKSKVALLTLLALLVVLLLYFLWVRHTRSTQNIPMDSISHISSIYILTKEDGIEEARSLSGKDISDELETDLLQCIGRYSMTRAKLSTPQSAMAIAGSYAYISIWIFNTDGTSFRVNASSNKYHSSVQFDETHFGIVDSSQMSEDIESILMPIF